MSTRLIGFAVSIYILAAFAAGQKGAIPRTDAALPESPRVVSTEAIILNARLAPPELASDTLIKIATSGLNLRNDDRKFLIEEAIKLAREVKNPVRMRLVPIQGVAVDTETGYLSYAFELKLDGLSLMSRAIKAMVPLDRTRARHLIFLLNGKLGLGRIACSDTLTYDVSDIYSTVMDVAKAGFTKKEIETGSRALFLLPWLENLESPSQVGPALDLLIEFSLQPNERELLTSFLSRSLRRNFGDDRSFTFSIERDQILSKVARLISGPAAPSKIEIKSAFREYLGLNLGSPRCKGNEIANESKIPAYAADINRIYFDDPIKFELVGDMDVTESPKVRFLWTSEMARKLMQQLRAIRLIGQSNGQTPDDSDQRYEKIISLLELLDSWKADGDEPDSAIFNQKCIVYRTLLSSVPESNDKKLITRSYLRYLSSAPMQKTNFIEWYLHVKHLANVDFKLFEEMSSEIPNQTFILLKQLKLVKL